MNQILICTLLVFVLLVTLSQENDIVSPFVFLFNSGNQSFNKRNITPSKTKSLSFKAIWI